MLGIASPSRVELVYWSPLGRGTNFGDRLSPVVVGELLADRGYSLTCQAERPRRLLAIGSILHFARDGDVIWGTGLNGKIDSSEHRFETVDVRAVRGPLTAEFLAQRGVDVPEVYGDPALLLPHLFAGCLHASKRRAHVFMPHLHDLAHTAGWPDVISPRLPWSRCLLSILDARFVMASSLHGLVVAEAFGIPARYVRLSDAEDLFKYQDYVLGTGRPKLEYARCREEAIEMGGMAPPTFDERALLRAFPFDLWTAPRDRRVRP
jgi:pyruvyltransferase